MFKSLIYSPNYRREELLYFSKCFYKFKNRFVQSFINNGCALSGSGQNLLKYLKLGRHIGKKFAAKGYIQGLRKCSF